ncbi:glycosyl hydrolase family 31, partial [Streptomyces sp. NPDC006339]
MERRSRRDRRRRRDRGGGRLTVLGLVAALVAALLSLGGPVAPAAAASAGNATGVTRSGNTFTISTSTAAKARVVVARQDIFRIWLSPRGTFTDDPAGNALATDTDFGSVTTNVTDAGAYYRITTPALSIRVNKSPLRFSVYRADDTTLVWQEAQPLSWTGSQTTQHLTQGADEQFYGTGLRLGEWALRGKTVPVAVSNTWKENTNASPAPFYMSTNGYGVMRNTWAPGSYSFGAPGTFTHDESRFDAWYFVADSLKGVLDAYTDVSGKPFLAPLWGFELGNADCWNASNPDYNGDHNRPRHQTTPDVVGYADDARAAHMPNRWFHPQQPYRCGYP